MAPAALIVFLLLNSFIPMLLSAHLPSLVLPAIVSEPSNGTNATIRNEETPIHGANPSRFPRAWPAPPFAWRADHDMILHFESYERQNVMDTLLEGLQAIIPNSFSMFMLHRGLGLEDAAPLTILSFPAPTMDKYERPLLHPANVQVDFMNMAGMPGAAYRVGDMERTIRAIIKKIRDSRVGHYTEVVPVIGGLRYKKVYVQRRT